MTSSRAIFETAAIRSSLMFVLFLFGLTIDLFAQSRSVPIPPPPDELPQPRISTVPPSVRRQIHHVPLTTEQIFKQFSPSVVLIRTANRAGTPLAQASGVVIAQGGLILTNYHVLEGACNVSIEMQESATPVPVRWLVAVDKSHDLVAISTENTTPVALAFGSSKDLLPGAKVIVIGNPEGLARSVSEGVIASKRVIDGTDWLQITAPISHGSSGGAVFDKFGALVGITTASLEEGQNINFAIPIEAVDRLFAARADPLPTPWFEAAAQFCRQEASTMDASHLRELLGKRMQDSEVQQVLMRIGAGTLPKPLITFLPATKAGDIPVNASETADYFGHGMQLRFVDDLLSYVVFSPSFEGILPLGLSWDDCRFQIDERLGLPSCCADPATPNEKALYSYTVGDYEYGLKFSAVGHLSSLQIALKWPGAQ